MVMPLVLYSVILAFFMLRTGAFAQVQLQQWFFVFEIIFVVLVTTIGQNMVHSIKDLTSDAADVFRHLGDELPKTSNYYLCYVVICWGPASMDMLRLIAL